MNTISRRSFSFFSLLLRDISGDLPRDFQKGIEDNHTAAQELLSDISIYYRKRNAARRAALFVIARYGEGDMAVFNRDLIRVLAREVWKTREDPMWLDPSEESNSNSSNRTKNV